MEWEWYNRNLILSMKTVSCLLTPTWNWCYNHLRLCTTLYLGSRQKSDTDPKLHVDIGHIILWLVKTFTNSSIYADEGTVMHKHYLQHYIVNMIIAQKSKFRINGRTDERTAERQTDKQNNRQTIDAALNGVQI